MAKTPAKLLPEQQWQEPGLEQVDSRLCLGVLEAEMMMFVLARSSLAFSCVQELRKPSFSLCSARVALPSSMESQDWLGWKRPLRSLSPIIDPAQPRPLQHVPRCHGHVF